jgi:hypothetical protein
MREGERHGRWLVLEDARISTDKVRCRCDCGTEAAVNAESMRKGLSQSCGCLRAQVTRERSIRHGFSGHPLWGTWYNMVARCTNPGARQYADYGGRGITVCERWSGLDGAGFVNFLADMGPKPSRRHSLERLDNDGGYEPANCVWATWAQQFANRRRHITNAEHDALKAEYDVLAAERDALAAEVARLRARLANTNGRPA